MFESERVLFPSLATRWRDELIEEIASFPQGRHDDQVDALVYALERLRGRGGGSAEGATIGYDGPSLRDDLDGYGLGDLETVF